MGILEKDFQNIVIPKITNIYIKHYVVLRKDFSSRKKSFSLKRFSRQKEKTCVYHGNVTILSFYLGTYHKSRCFRIFFEKNMRKLCTSQKWC